MSLTNSLLFAWRSIARQRLRSMLALLGISVGALAIVSVVSVEQSWQRTIDRTFEGMDLESMNVRVPPVSNPKGAGLRRTEFTDDDAEAIRKQCPAVENLSVYTGAMGTVRSGRENRLSEVCAYESGFTDILPLPVHEGRSLTNEELDQGAYVCTLSPALRKRLFPGREAIVEKVRLEGVAFQVVGVVTAADEGPEEPIERIYIPRRLFRQVFHQEPETRIQAGGPDMGLAASQIEAVLHQRLGGDEEVKFVQSRWLARQVAREVRRGVRLIGFLAALCALVLGGYGVGSVLYVSVAEGAREIGVRRALGAVKADAGLEVVLAGVIFGVIGAALGTAIGSLGVRLIVVPGVPLTPEFKNVYAQVGGGGALPIVPAEFAATVSWEAVLTAIVFSLAVCLLASLEPALEVAHLDPARAISVGMAPSRSLRLGVALVQMSLAVAVVALLPALYEALDERDRLAMRKTFGPNRIRVTLYDTSVREGPMELPSGAEQTLASFQEALASPTFTSDLLAACPALSSATPWIHFFGATLKAGSQVTQQATLHFVGPSFYPTETGPTRNSSGYGDIEQGQFFTEAAARAGERMCVLDSEAAGSLFGEAVGVGQVVRVNGVPLRVVGTMGAGTPLSGANISVPRGGGGGVRGGPSAQLFVPASLYEELLPLLLSGRTGAGEEPLERRAMSTTLVARATDMRAVPRAAQQLRSALIEVVPGGRGHHLFLSEPTYGTLQQYFSLRAGAALRSAFSAAILLLVALIGLANTLLVSLSEQTREVGLRRALGAQKHQVMLPLLAEGLSLAALGSVVGILLACLLSWALRGTAPGLEFLSLSAFWAVTACVAMLLTSLLVSLIPAGLATRVDPATSLRSE